jgi:hypothetical protein
VNPFLGLGIIATAVVAGMGAMLLARRFAPVGGLHSSTRGIGSYASVISSYAIVLAFVILVAFQSYANARRNAQDEAAATLELYRTTDSFPAEGASVLQGDLTCYARSVVALEWPLMRDERRSPATEHWVDELQGAFDRVATARGRGAFAYGHWLDQYGNRAQARSVRLAEAAPFVPAIAWAILIAGGFTVIAYACLWADPGERKLVQLPMVGIVAGLIASGLILVRFFDVPYENVNGSIRPTAMQSSLALMHPLEQPPCDADGRPVPRL